MLRRSVGLASRGNGRTGVCHTGRTGPTALLTLARRERDFARRAGGERATASAAMRTAARPPPTEASGLRTLLPVATFDRARARPTKLRRRAQRWSRRQSPSPGFSSRRGREHGEPPARGDIAIASLPPRRARGRSRRPARARADRPSSERVSTYRLAHANVASRVGLKPSSGGSCRRSSEAGAREPRRARTQ